MLLAEDNLINQTVAKKMLGHMGMICTVASNGAEAVDALRAAAAQGTQYELVLMDMAMPVMGGVDATKVSHTIYVDCFMSTSPPPHPPTHTTPPSNHPPTNPTKPSNTYLQQNTARNTYNDRGV